uniref:uncharacterized protein LOC117157809 n=1 Tax=Bombus vancouverensis nearcticus TaxID=2705178 RepID=UPI001439D67D|nr:uncharacterized protein LOC117157809 [Bombus vancouverensis nearcticus]
MLEEAGPANAALRSNRCNQPTNQPTRQASRFRIRVGEEALRSRRVRELRQRSNYLSVKWNSSLRSFIKTFTIGFERPVDKSRKQYRRAIVSVLKLPFLSPICKYERIFRLLHVT